jgi:hypothetical protein
VVPTNIWVVSLDDCKTEEGVYLSSSHNVDIFVPEVE